MKKKFIYLLFLFILPLLMCSCGNKGSLHSKEDILDYLDNLECYTDKDTQNTSSSCHLKNNYELVSEDTYNDDNGEVRELTLKLKDYDVTFKAKSAYECTKSIDGSCFEYTYKITTDYQKTVYKYFKEDFFNSYNLPCLKTTTSSTTYCTYGFKIDSKNDIKKVVEYLDDYLSYLNDFKNHFVPYLENITIIYPKTYSNGVYYSQKFYIRLINDKYYYYENVYEDDKLVDTILVKNSKNNINEYIETNDIF